MKVIPKEGRGNLHVRICCFASDICKVSGHMAKEIATFISREYLSFMARDIIIDGVH